MTFTEMGDVGGGAGLREIEQWHLRGRGLDASEVLKTSGEERLAYNSE